MNDQEKWKSLLASIAEVAGELQRYPPKKDELREVRQVDRTLWSIMWDCEDTEREEVK